MFLISEFQQTDKELSIVISMEQEVNNPYVCFRLRDNERFEAMEHKEQYRVKPAITEKGYEVNLNIDFFLNKFTNLCGKKNVVDLYISSGKDYYRVLTDKKVTNYVKGMQSVSLNKLVELKTYITVTKTMGFQLISKEIVSTLRNIGRNEECNVEISIDTNLPDNSDGVNISNVLLKRRVAKDVLVYSEGSYLTRKNLNTYVLSKDNFNNFTIDEKTLFDIVVQYKQDNIIVEVPLRAESFDLDVKPKINIGIDVSAKVYINKGDNLSVNVERLDKEITVNSVSMDKNSIALYVDLSHIFKERNIKNPHLSNIELHVYKRFSFQDNEEIYFYKSVKADLDDKLFLKATLNIFDLFKSNKSNRSHQYIMYICIRLGYEKSYFRMKAANKISEIFTLDETMIEFNLKDRAEFIVSNMKTNPVKIGVFGSCFSRAAFTSNDEYFNPDYKKYFQVVYSHFWPSVISIVSSPIDYDKSEFNDLTEKEMMEIEREFCKNTFEKLKQQEVDYILIDFYNDAIHGVIKLLNNKGIVARNVTLKKAKYFANHILYNSINIDYRDPGYFKLWRDSCDIFVRKLTQIVPEERIILNVSKLTDKYYDEENKVQSFIKKNKITAADLKYYNLAWGKMDSYFLSKVPNAQVLDLNKYKFLSASTHPVSCGPHHFESDYYKKQLDELVRIVFLNR